MTLYVDDHGRFVASVSMGRVPEAEIRCPLYECIHGMGVAGNGICGGDGDPRDAKCAALKPECPDCHGYGTADEESVEPCPTCGGMGWIKENKSGGAASYADRGAIP